MSAAKADRVPDAIAEKEQGGVGVAVGTVSELVAYGGAKVSEAEA